MFSCPLVTHSLGVPIPNCETESQSSPLLIVLPGKTTSTWGCHGASLTPGLSASPHALYPRRGGVVYLIGKFGRKNWTVFSFLFLLGASCPHQPVFHPALLCPVLCEAHPQRRRLDPALLLLDEWSAQYCCFISVSPLAHR